VTITPDQVMPLILEACPSFLPTWRKIENDDLFIEDDGSRSGYGDSAEVARHVVELQRAGQTAELPAVFAVIERLRRKGDEYVQTLAWVGYLEDVQNVALRAPSVPLEDFEPYLGEQSARDWHRLIAEWSGRAQSKDERT
jgi:hypothetical protein